MSVRRYVLKVYEKFRPLVVPYYNKLIEDGLVSPADIALTLYDILKVRYRVRGDTLYGPTKIGSIDLREIGFLGAGMLSLEYLAPYEVLESTFEAVPYILDVDDVKYTNFRYSLPIASHRDPESVVYVLERDFEGTIVEASIDYFIDRDEFIVEVEYRNPIAPRMSLFGGIFLFSVAIALQRYTDALVVDYSIDSDDEYRLVGYFEYVKDRIL